MKIRKPSQIQAMKRDVAPQACQDSMKAGSESERARIVAWLRSWPERAVDVKQPISAEIAEWVTESVAVAIERGEHLK